MVANKPDSHDICFIADGDNAGWLAEKLGDLAPNRGGDIVDSASGDVLGQHEGTFGFTIGQRKGLRIGHPAPDGRPRFVLDIEPVSGTVTVGPREELRIDRILGDRARWCGSVTSRLEGTVQLRAHGAEHRAIVRTFPAVEGGHVPQLVPEEGVLRPSRRARNPGPDSVEIDLLDPAEGIAPGQAAVIYDGTRVVGSATITATSRVSTSDGSAKADSLHA